MALLGRLPRRWKVVLFSAGALALIAAAGWGLTLLLAAQIRARLPRQVTAERIRISPWTLVLTVDGLRIADRKGSPLFSCRRLSVDFLLRSALTKEFVLRDVSLVDPAANVVIDRDGSLNLTDLTALVPPPPPGQAPAPPSRGIRVQRLTIAGARLAFDDRSRRPEFSMRAGPMWFQLEDFRTLSNGLNRFSFSGSTDSGERFWWLGNFGTNPFRSEGAFSISGLRLAKYAPYYQAALALKVDGGALSARGRYLFDASPKARKLSVERGSLALRGLQGSDPASGEKAVSVASADVNGAAIDLVARSAHVASFTSRGGALLCRREADGNVNLQRLFAPPPSPRPSPVGTGEGVSASAAAPPVAVEPPRSPSSAPALDLAVGRIAFESYSVKFEDVSTPRPVDLDLSDIHMTLANFVNRPERLSDFLLEAVWAGEGRVVARGPVSPMARRGTLDVRADRLALAPLAPYLERFTRVRLRTAELSGQGRMEFVAEPPDFRFRGDVRFDRFEAAAIPSGKELFGWSSLSGSSIDFGFPAKNFSVRTIALASPRVKWEMDPSGASVLMAALEPPPAPREAPAAAASVPASDASAPAAPSKPFRIRIGEFRVTGGRADFVDESVSPRFAFSLTELAGAVRGLSSEETARAKVDLRGKLGGAGPIALAGELNPLARAAFTNLTLDCKAVDLPPFGPYSGKYLGYGIRKGKLALDLKYRIENRKLDATNLITADQFYLGEKVASPSATKLPVKLAIALLRDRRGRILLDVPVSGDLGDPKFRFGRVIVRVLVNILTKAATAPFALLSKAFGGSEGGTDLRYQEFSAGVSTLTEDAGRKLDALAQALADHPDLTVEIGGGADESADRPALEHRKLERLAAERKAAGSTPAGGGGAAPESPALTPEEYPRYLAEAYLAAFPPKDPAPAEKKKRKKSEREAPPPTPPLEEIEKSLLERSPVTADDVNALADARRQAVRDRLLQGGRVGPERLFLTEGPPASGADGSAPSQSPAPGGPKVVLNLSTGPD